MSKFDEAIEVMKRIEGADGTKDGKMMVKGTILMDGEETVQSSFDNTTTASISRSLIAFTEICENCIRTVDPSDKVEFIKVNCATRAMQHELMLATDGDFQAIVVQEHPIRDLRKRSSKEQKNLKGYLYVQKNLFYPSIDGMEPPPI